MLTSIIDDAAAFIAVAPKSVRFRKPEVAAVANGGGPIAGTMLLTPGVR
jgi:hypothetical protein